MTPGETLTDEELAEIESRDYFTGEETPRLIAALRASRAEAEEAWSRGRSYGQAVCESELVASRAEVERLRDGLDFYANPNNWEARLIRQSVEGEPNPGSSQWEIGPADDGGERARRVLNVEVKR